MPQCHPRTSKPWSLAMSSGGVAYATEYRGDWKWQREAFGLSAHWGAVGFCHVCTAKGRGNPLHKCPGLNVNISLEL